jgi:hypothetical protein
MSYSIISFFFANTIPIVRLLSRITNRVLRRRKKKLTKKLNFFRIYSDICSLYVCNYISLYMLSRTESRGVQTASETSCHQYWMADSTTQFAFSFTSACKYAQIIYCLHLRLAPKVISSPPSLPRTCDPESTQIFQLNLLVHVTGNRYNLLGNKYSRQDQI